MKILVVDGELPTEDIPVDENNQSQDVDADNDKDANDEMPY
jgi:hypothetical protein